MPFAASNDIELYYETHGDANDPPLLLINGFSSQILGWHDGYREALADRGRYVISFDNRDVGLSTKLDGQEANLEPLMAALEAGEPLPSVPYTLTTMAADAVGLLDHLDIEAAHVAGSSMGGMIAQQFAIDHPTRVLTLTSVMSTSGEPEYFESTPEATAALTGPRPTEREAFIADAVERRAVTSSTRYFDPVETTKMTADAYDRMFYPEGLSRQMAAIRASGDREVGLRALTVPTLVIHGREDPLILLNGGERTAELVPGASLLVVNDMSHDLPRPLWSIIIDAIISHTGRSSHTGPVDP